jgi:Predicted ATPase with chaperone activity
MIGPPGAGKSMLASRLPSILPPLGARELLDVSMIQSIAGELAGGALSDRRPFRAPHHSASMAALVGGGLKVRPGEASLAHNGVLFLDELPEFAPSVLLKRAKFCSEAQCSALRNNRQRPFDVSAATNSSLKRRIHSGLRFSAHRRADESAA